MQILLLILTLHSGITPAWNDGGPYYENLYDTYFDTYVEAALNVGPFFIGVRPVLNTVPVEEITLDDVDVVHFLGFQNDNFKIGCEQRFLKVFTDSWSFQWYFYAEGKLTLDFSEVVR